MRRFLVVACCGLAAGLVGPSPALAQLTIRVPFVRVEVGGPGVRVRAPLVNLFVPSPPPDLRVMPPAEENKPKFTPPPPAPEDGKKPTPKDRVAPTAKPTNADEVLPVPATSAAVLTLEQFARSFQPKAGSYEVTLLNPVTRGPTMVRFTLPEGTPRRVQVARNRLEFDYGPRSFVRIEFTTDGAVVTSR
ncbi:MAG: hypothetical protein NZO58_05420 [Gemmataceae bacterium]|nr:hypothetical protein [Gemmataceae bacterium]